MRPDSDGAGRRLQAGRGLRLSLLAKLLLVNLSAVAAATLLSGVGAVIMADLIIVRGDMMVAEHYQVFRAQINWYLLGVTALTFALAGGGAWYLSRQIIRPLDRIRKVAEAVAAGDYRPRLRERTGGELGQLAAAIDRMTQSLSQVEQLRRDMVSNVAHELRTPLTSAHGLVCALRDGLVPADPETLEQVGEEMARLIRLVEALHQLSQSDAATVRGLVRQRLDLAALVSEVTAGMLPLFEMNRQELQIEAGTVPLWIEGDRDALVQVLVNLLDNAAKYSPEGEAIRVGCVAQANVATITVVNGGSGIAPEDLPHIFERFYRGEKSRSRESGGAGIGLAIARNLVEAHGGSISVESMPGRTAFTVQIPQNPSLRPPRADL